MVLGMFEDLNCTAATTVNERVVAARRARTCCTAPRAATTTTPVVIPEDTDGYEAKDNRKAGCPHEKRVRVHKTQHVRDSILSQVQSRCAGVLTLRMCISERTATGRE